MPILTMSFMFSKLSSPYPFSSVICFQVTKLDRDPASGTALQEISFWLNLERALNRIQEKRESPEVLLTLDILKHGKRFHATVSFDTDTGELTAGFDISHTRHAWFICTRHIHSALQRKKRNQ